MPSLLHALPQATREQSKAQRAHGPRTHPGHPGRRFHAAEPGKQGPTRDRVPPGRRGSSGQWRWVGGPGQSEEQQNFLSGPPAACPTRMARFSSDGDKQLEPSPVSSSAAPRILSWEQWLHRGQPGKRDPRGAHVLCLGELQVGHGRHHAQHRCARWPDAGAPPLDDLLHIPREQPVSEPRSWWGPLPRLGGDSGAPHEGPSPLNRAPTV